MPRRWKSVAKAASHLVSRSSKKKTSTTEDQAMHDGQEEKMDEPLPNDGRGGSLVAQHVSISTTNAEVDSRGAEVISSAFGPSLPANFTNEPPPVSRSGPAPVVGKSRGLGDLDAAPSPPPSKSGSPLNLEMAEVDNSEQTVKNTTPPRASYSSRRPSSPKHQSGVVSRPPPAFVPPNFPDADVRVDVAMLLHHYGIAGSENNLFVASFVPTMSRLLSSELEESAMSPMHGLELSAVKMTPKVTEALADFGVDEVLHAGLVRDLKPLLFPPPPDILARVEEPDPADKRRKGIAFILLALAAAFGLLTVALAIVAIENEENGRSTSSTKSSVRLEDDTATSANLSDPVPGSSVVIETRTDRPGRTTHAPSMAPIVEILVEKMTTTEKHAMLLGVGFEFAEFEPSRGYYVGNIQEIQRLGVPSLNIQDAGQGFRTVDKRMVGQVTSWPCALAMASTWDSDLIYNWATATAAEFRAKGANVVLGPGVNVHRVARGGRNAEYLSGEDPHLGAVLVQPFVRGFQDNGVLCVVKHFALNSQETKREYVNSILPDATAAWEVFYPPFQAAVDAGVAAVMCSYNYVNGTHSCGNEQLLKSDLKETMEFKGFVISDWWATHSTAAEEGMDMEMPGNFDGNLLEPYYSPSNLASYGNATIDGMVTRVLTPMVEVGLIGGSDVKPRCTPGVDCDSMLYEVIATNKTHRDLALRVATESVLLLQNENSTLPLRAALNGPATFTIAVVGSACNASNDVEAMLPTFDVGNYYTIGGSGRVIPGSVVTVVNGLRRQAASKTSATVTLVESLTDDVPSALAALQSADYAVVCGGGTTAEMSDRPNLLLDQNDFIVAVANAASVPVVVVMLCPGPVLTPFKGDVAAIVALFLGGASTGDAVAAVLFGDHNPHAKSPVTFPLDEADTVAPCEPPNYYWSGFDCPYTEGLLVGYKAFDAFEKNVSFPFGHGLSFTAFEYSWAQAPALLPDGGVGFTVSLANAGAINGSEVLQVYTTFPLESNVPATTKALKAFRKVHVGAGLSENIAIELGPSSFQRWDNTAWSFVGSPDRYTLYIGSSSRDIRLSAEVDIYL